MHIDNVVNVIEKPDQLIIEFENGYQASIIGDPINDEAFEVAVMFQGNLDYTTPVTDDVICNLTDDEVGEVCKQISELPAKLYQFDA